MSDYQDRLLERIAEALETIANAITPEPEACPDASVHGLLLQLRDWRWQQTDPAGWANELLERKVFHATRQETHERARRAKAARATS
jgi:hypothetical protein